MSEQEIKDWIFWTITASVFGPIFIAALWEKINARRKTTLERG